MTANDQIAEIATRLMEAWFQGPSATIDAKVIQEMSVKCLKAAKEIIYGA